MGCRIHHHKKTREQAIIDLLESIAIEETALAHVINVEAKKIQCSLLPKKGCLDFEHVLRVQEKVNEMLKTCIKYQMLLQFKLDQVTALDKEGKIPKPIPKHLFEKFPQ